MDPARREILGFALRALAWLPFTLAAWYFGSSALAWVPVRIAASGLGLAGVSVASPRIGDGTAFMEARLQPPYRPGVASLEAVEVVVEVKTRTFTFGIALYLALSLAFGRPWRPGTLALGCAILVALPAWSIAFDTMRQLAGVPSLGPILGWPPAGREAIAFGHQVGSLLLPTLGPVALWIGLDPRVARGTSEEDPPSRP